MCTVNEISVAQAKALLNERNDILVMDRRDPESYKQGHIDNAMMAHDGLIEATAKKGDKQTPILIYCYHGVSSLELAKLFAVLGFKEVYSMTGGYAEWSRAHG